MSAPGKLQPIIIKRVKKGGHGGHHGGAWKIAYADFVTAMMAFFLLMWLLGSTAQGDLQGIAAYFQSPLKVALTGGSGSGDSSSIIKGGGTILTRTNGSVKRGEIEAPSKTFNLQALRSEVEAADTNRMKKVQSQIEGAMQANAVLAGLKKQLRMDIVPDGLRIQIVDEQGRPMFDSGSARVKDYMRELLRNIGRLVNDADGRVVLSGHTDASPYSGGERGYSNWELSADRANASRRELLAGGLAEDRVVRVLGLGSSVPFDAADPQSPLNRRISILVLGQLGSARWASGTEVPVSEAQALEKILSQREGEAAPAAAQPDATPSNVPGAKP
ncbi:MULTISPECIES: flagellar motor protein MotB [Ramlibacter]|uniref:Flagellar motor protein MotB n=1 Tax=Ramlibacter aquaticus TaxID=2780094 RepID=A0ABR9SA27_9BURK|nr:MULTISPECIES: flagellar motor protein MotB [Ramlibacter]MBE7939201.1 flagellar motor protein MotB [Ramlibacter aquaticus]